MTKTERALASLRNGKELRVKHPVFNLSIKGNVKLVGNSLVVDGLKISLPQKATKLEKLLMKLVQIYCSDVLLNNLSNDFINSPEYNKLKASIGQVAIAS